MPSRKYWGQRGQGRRFRPKPFDFSYILNPYPPVASHLANSTDSLSLADETASQSTNQDSDPVICKIRSCRNPVRANRKRCGDCLDRMSAQRRARVQKRRRQGVRDPITGETTKQCADCGRPSDKYRCPPCSKKGSAASLALYHRRREKGRCPKCGGEIDREGYCCERCHLRDLSIGKTRRKRKSRGDSV